MWNLFVSSTFLLVSCGRLVAHPLMESAEMPYSGPVSVEDRGAESPDELSYSEQMYLPHMDPALRFASLLSGEINREGLRTSGLPKQVQRDVLLEKSNHLNPFSRFLGIRKQFKKRGGNSECFWKYCV